MSPPYPAWDAAFNAWEAARRAELAHDANVTDPAFTAGTDTSEMWEESDRLTDVRAEAEDAIFELPALNAEQLALKILIAMDNGRAADFYYASIFRDCRRFTSDELTRGPDSVGTDAQPIPSAGCRALLDERNAALIAANAMPAGAEGEDAYNAAVNRSITAHNEMFDRPAAIGDDVIAKLIAIAQEVTDGGGCPCETQAAQAIREAKAFFGMGWVDLSAIRQMEAGHA